VHFFCRCLDPWRPEGLEPSAAALLSTEGDNPGAASLPSRGGCSWLERPRQPLGTAFAQAVVHGIATPLFSLLGGHHDALQVVEQAAQALVTVEVQPLQLLLALHCCRLRPYRLKQLQQPQAWLATLVEDRLLIPVRRSTPIQKQEQVKNRWVLGYDEEDRDDFFHGRSLDGKVGKRGRLQVQPQPMGQRAINGETNSYPLQRPF
jgi:hypothetical protein